jgi:hypothetical protein
MIRLALLHLCCLALVLEMAHRAPLLEEHD